MIVAKALIFNNERSKFLNFNSIEHPIALQVGGNDPLMLGEIAKIAEDWGYDEINLNIGCPSQKVQSGDFGACLMARPALVANCIEKMKSKSKIPVTVKHRTGIDNLNSDKFLIDFVDQVSKAGADRFIIHARKALLSGLDPKQNRNIPPLEYNKVANLKKQRPDLIIELNGGLQNPYDCLEALKFADGAMVGRAIYSHPMNWQKIDSIIFKEKLNSIKASEIISKLIPYAEDHISEGGRIWNISRHLLKLVEGVPGAKKWRYELTNKSQKKDAKIIVLEEAARQLKEVGL